MTKYNPKFKHQVIKEYLNGNVTYAYLTQKYQISSSKQVQEWVRQYKLFGKKGLECKQRQDYTGEFRLNVLIWNFRYRNHCELEYKISQRWY